jgi:hypothetical protein
LQFIFDYYLTLGHNNDVRVDEWCNTCREEKTTTVMVLSLIAFRGKIRLFWSVTMFEVSDESGNTFVFDSFEEISQFFGECVWAVGAVDAKITVKFANPTND